MAETLTVGELCGAIRGSIEERFPNEVWVTGAISGLSRPQNGGHVYFNLVDPADEMGSTTPNVLPIALFSKAKHTVNAILRRTGNIRMHDGVEIRIRGSVVYYPPQGRVQLVMSLIDPAYTVGQMAIARDVLLTKLSAEGLLELNGQLDLPVAPLRIGLVTSAGSAAHADFGHELETSGYRFDVHLFDARVQGIDAVPSLVEGIERAGRADVDVVVVIRGGGAKTDLAAFDHERVAKAIARCQNPVVVGVGHEVDRSVADVVAHTSAKTPTAAAGVLIDAVERFDFEVEQAASRLLTLATGRLHAANGELTSAAHRLRLAATATTDHHDGLLDRSMGQLEHLAVRALDRADSTIETATVRLRALDPERVLARGWSITHTADGSLVRSPGDAPAGSSLVTTTAAGRIASTSSGPIDPEDDDRAGGAKRASSSDTGA